MNELQIINNQLPATVKPSEKVLLNAFDGVKIAKIEFNDLGRTINDLLSKAYFHTGIKLPSDSELFALGLACCESIKSNIQFSLMTDMELELAFKRGADKEYGEFFGINPATVNQWIKGYLNAEERKNAKLIKAESDRKVMHITKEPTPEEFRERFITRLKELYQSYLNNSQISPSEAAYYFNILYREHIITFDIERRAELKNRAFKIVTRRNDPESALSLDERRKLGKVYEQLIVEGTESQMVKLEAMNLGLLAWFSDLKEFETTIEEALI